MRGNSVRLLLAVLLLAVSVSECVEIVVGGTKGWTTGFDYDAWAARQNFRPRVGDSLVFLNPDSEYHTVSLLDSLDAYQRCTLGGIQPNATHPARPGENYTMIIPESLSGKMLYAVCTVSGHCLEGQKISATVLPAAVGIPLSSPPASPPELSDADMNQYICWTTAILLIVACFWNSG